jgi:lipopolysaccharide transport system ATP-binding protein
MIDFDRVSLRYPLMAHKSHSLQSHLFNSVGGALSGRRADLVEYVQALSDINLRIKDGSRLGIIGHNGAGKTTLLRVISGVYPPTAGSAKIHGRVNALTDFTLGMDPNADGVKNIVFRLVFMGYTFTQARSAIDEIIDFSGLGEFINLPLRTYSTGMYLRLAFAISTHFAPDILVLDEIVGAGDEAFREKAKGRLTQLIGRSRIVVLSSHDLSAVRNYCTDAVWMEKGTIKLSGDVTHVASEYLASAQNTYVG